MNKPFLAIITPTYNRAKSLNILYKSLKAQTCQDFIWYVVDDGSNDNTHEIIEKFMDINFKYFHKPNGGKHTAINYIRKYVNSSAVFIVDSDDYLEINAVSTIKDNWLKYQDFSIISHWYLQQDINTGKVVGKSFKKNAFKANYKDVILKPKMGDKKVVYDSTLFKSYEFPEFPDEYFLAESTFHIDASNLGDSYFFNTPLYFSEYKKDGLTKQGKKLQLENPLGGLENSIQFINSTIKLKVKVKKVILFNVYSILSHGRYTKKLKTISIEWATIAIVLYPISYLIKIRWKRDYLND